MCLGCLTMNTCRCLAGLFGITLSVITVSGCTIQPSASQDANAITATPVLQGGKTDVSHVYKAMLREQRILIDYRVEGKPQQFLITAEPVTVDPSTDPGKMLPIRALLSAHEAYQHNLQVKASPIEVYGTDAWQSLLYASLRQLTPETSGYGACVDILKQQELFLYRDGRDMLISVPLVYKPAEVKVSRSYTFDHLLQVMAQQLHARSLDGERYLFETGDDSQYGYPFVYADKHTDLILFLQKQAVEQANESALPLGTTLEMLTRTIIGHIQAVINQPVTSITRLFTMVSVSTVDLARPTPLALVEYDPIPPLNAGEGMDLVQWEAYLDEITGSSPSSGRLEYLVDGVSFFPRLIDTVSTASESVYLRIYIFDDDDYATRIADLLKRRSTELEIRVLVDELGTLGATMADSASLPPGHVPATSIMRYLEQDSDVNVRSVSNIWLSSDHTKSIIVDDRIAFIGGMNIGREYRYDWHDMMIELKGPVVSEIGRDFDRAWASAGFLGDLQRLGHIGPVDPVPASETDYAIRLLYTRPGDSQILRAQIAATRQVQQYIYLQNPYITSDAMLYELVKARRRGVDVRVIMPYQSDSGVITRSNVLVANAMLRNGIRVYIYPGMSHLKAAIYDGWACLGSANMDNLSLRTNREMNLATAHPSAVEALREQVFHADMEKSVELTEPLPANWADYLAELLADSL